MEMRVAVEEFLRRIPEFRPAGKTVWSQGAIRGPRRLPIVLG
jgi:cytochrome P450